MATNPFTDEEFKSRASMGNISRSIEDYRFFERFNLATRESDAPTVRSVSENVVFTRSTTYPEAWVDVRDYGAAGDAVTDDTAAIQDAIDSLQEITSSLKTDPYTYHDCSPKGVIYFPSGYRFKITSPLLMECDHSDTGNRIYMDRIILWGYGAEIFADSSFTGVSRYYDPTHTETINAMLIIGVKDFGKYPGLTANPASYWQNFNGVYGLTFVGDRVTATDLNAIRMELTRQATINDCIFDNFHDAINGRAVSLPQCKNNRCIYVNSFYHQVNDSADLGWYNGEGIDSDGPLINQVFVFRSKNYTSDSKYRNRGKIHLVNVGEQRVSNVTIFGGGGLGIFQANTQSPVKQHQYWGHYTDIEIAGMYYEALYFNKFHRVNVTNATFAYNQVQDADATNRPIVKLEDVNRINMSNFIIDESNPPGGAFDNHTSYPLILKGGGCHFTNFSIYGYPGTNNSYASIYVTDGSAGYEADDNAFSNFEAGNIYYASGNKFQNGILCDAGTNGNLFSNGTVKNCNSTRVVLKGTSKANNIITDEARDIASAGTVTLLDHGKYFNITGTTNITSVTASWSGRIVILKFAGILTFTDGSNLKLAGNFVTSADDTITLISDGTNWIETGRSAN